ncbi:fimbrillin family protein [Elizabethkingia sp. HX QKY]|uniref:fimbrillin family protein n=1 Tax=Elizabethkingia TaxID=308865 RepID=UPI002A24670E|nr:fimbrillin family protein [Elizabethkingia sp. HX QKY]MDX8573049.1 fimbrillin family protein [Elizabethkingia sp. HX QKY]
MKLKYYNKTALAVLILSFLMSSCRSVGSDNPENITDPPVSTGNASVVVNLLGSEFVESDGNNPQASAGKQLRNPQAAETYYTLINPSTLLAAEVSEESSVPLKASAGVNPVAVINGLPLANGAKFRLIAYKMDGSYAGYKDFTVDPQPNTTGGLRLPENEDYWMVVYSYGTNYLPNISFAETQSLGNARHTYDNMVGQNGFLYQIQMFTPREGDNTMSVILRHKIAQVTTKINSSGLSGSNKNITSVTSATLIGNNKNAVFNLSDGSAASRSTPENVVTTFGQSPSTEWTSNAVFINADSPVNKTISFSANVAINNQIAKPVTVTNGFIIKPGFRTIYKINLKETKCGALVLGVFREFECYNVGAVDNGKPFTPVAGIHGGKYQWNGTSMDQDKDQSNGSLSPSAAGFRIANIPDADGRNLDGLCSAGYRVPSADEWASFSRSNTFVSNTGSGLYGTGATVSYGGKTTLFLPFAGFRNYSSSSRVFFMTSRGIGGSYWSTTGSNNSSSENNSNALALGPSSILSHGYTVDVTNANPRTNGASVRCIKKLDTEN